MTGSEEAKGHKLITWKSGSNAYGSHFCYTTFILPASIYGLIGNSLQSADRGREDLGLVYRWDCAMCRYHPKVDNCYNTAPFWDIPEGQWWREILPLGRRTLSCASACLLYLEGEMTRRVIIYWFMGYDQWFGWMVRDLEGTWMENWSQGSLEKRPADRPPEPGKTWRYSYPLWLLIKGGPQQRRILILKWTESPYPRECHSQG